jgi:hypothetical protein
MKSVKHRAKKNQKTKRKSASTNKGFRYENGIPQPLAKSLWRSCI